MINKKNKFSLSILFLSLSLIFTSCDKVEDVNVGGSSTQEMAGEWYVQTYLGEDMVKDYVAISTYNTAANDGNEMWVNDHGHIWNFKTKTPINLTNLTFAGTDLESSVEDDDESTEDIIETYDITVTITNGQVTKNDTETSGGNTSNGISFDIEFSDDPGKTYTIKGYKRTGFPEDEH